MRLRAISKLAVVSLLMLVVITPAAFADDWNPPSYRGEELSVHATWDDLGWTSGEAFNLDVQRPSSMACEFRGSGEFNWNVRPEAIFYGQSMLIRLPNFIDEEPLKKVRIQLSGQNGDGGDWWGDKDNWDMLADPRVEWRISEYEQSDRSDVFQVSTDFEIRPNPDWEIVGLNKIPSGVVIDQVVVDTVSIPEPSTLTLAGLGTLLMGVYVLRRRRR